MLDYRLMTFIDVSKTKSFTKTAKNLCITQPAVTQHIKYLEELYETKLINHQGKKMKLTEAGEIVLKYALKTQALMTAMKLDLELLKTQLIKLNFGATLTIADFIMPNILISINEFHPNTRVNVIVDNTKHLVEKLRNGEIEFALIEGYFDKDEFEHHLLKKDRVIFVAGPDFKINPCGPSSLEELKKYVLIVREYGSGSRDILEKMLANQNASLNMFNEVMEVGSVKLIKDLVKHHIGITFIYQEAVREELNDGTLKEVILTEFNIEREFNFVFPKNSLNRQKYMDFLSYARNRI